MVMATATDEILIADYFARDGGDYITRCPHCKRVISMDGDEPVRGEMFQDRFCGGWLEVSSDAKRLRELPDLPSETITKDAP